MTDAYSHLETPRPLYKLENILIIKKENLIKTHNSALRKNIINTAMERELTFQQHFKTYIIVASNNKISSYHCKV
jgi:hypothetical protein